MVGILPRRRVLEGILPFAFSFVGILPFQLSLGPRLGRRSSSSTVGCWRGAKVIIVIIVVVVVVVVRLVVKGQRLELVKPLLPACRLVLVSSVSLVGLVC